jgi:hypothetical protein
MLNGKRVCWLWWKDKPVAYVYIRGDKIRIKSGQNDYEMLSAYLDYFIKDGWVLYKGEV